MSKGLKSSALHESTFQEAKAFVLPIAESPGLVLSRLGMPEDLKEEGRIGTKATEEAGTRRRNQRALMGTTSGWCFTRARWLKGTRRGVTPGEESLTGPS